MTTVFSSYEQAPVREFAGRADGRTRSSRDFFARTAPPTFHIGPEAFMLTLPDHSTVRPHFHEVDQFQIIFGDNGGVYQRSPLPQITLHYADAYTTYGPFGDADGTFRFITLRSVVSTVLAYMPGDRDQKRMQGRRNKHVALDAALAGELTGERQTAVVIERDADQMAAAIVRTAPGCSVALDPSPNSGGRYLFVVNGGLDRQGDTLGRYSVGWTPAPEDDVQLGTASADGCDLLVMQMPHPPTNHVLAGAH